MKLKFQKELKGGKPTGFAEKILAGLYINAKNSKEKELLKEWHQRMAKKQIIEPFLNSIPDRYKRFPPKYHTIRSLKSPIDVGDDIEYGIAVSKSKYVEFAPSKKVLSIQYLRVQKELKEGTIHWGLDISNDKETWFFFYDDIHQLALNNGFDAAEGLLEYLIPETPEEGKALEVKKKLVHWTNLSYPAQALEDVNSDIAEE